jgi:hypothetical protein
LDVCSHLFGKYEWDLGSGEWNKNHQTLLVIAIQRC